MDGSLRWVGDGVGALGCKLVNIIMKINILLYK